MTEIATSPDGTTIAYDRVGIGPLLVLVGGALNTRFSGSGLGELLQSKFTVVTFDRRGRGESQRVDDFAAKNEIADLVAVIEAAGGEAAVFGHSSGAVLALEAAMAGAPITRLAVYEPPYTADPDADESPEEFTAKISKVIAAGDNEGAVLLFMGSTGMPQSMIDGMRGQPFWPAMVDIAPSLMGDMNLVGDGTVPAARLASITVPVLVMDGALSPPWAGNASSQLVAALPNARHLSVEGATHNVDDEVLAPLLVEYFA